MKLLEAMVVLSVVMIAKVVWRMLLDFVLGPYFYS